MVRRWITYTTMGLILLVLSTPAHARPVGRIVYAPADAEAERIARPRIDAANFGSSGSIPGAGWTALDDMPLAVHSSGGAYVAGKFYVPGGLDALSEFSNALQVYDGTSWSIDSQSLPFALADAAVCAADGKLHVINGYSDFGFVSSHMMYDPAAGHWIIFSPPSVGGSAYLSAFSGCTSVDGRLFLYSGYGNTPPYSGFQDLTWVWDADSDTWHDTGYHLNQGRARFGYTNGDNDRAAVVAGGNNGSTLASVEIFRPGQGWARLPDLPTGLEGSGVALVGRRALIFGGVTTSGVDQAALLGCQAPCRTGWTDMGHPMIVARSYFAWGNASGGETVQLYAAGGLQGPAPITAAERFDAP